MLLELTVENLLIVRSARLEPGAGLTVISGETGAGKSLLLDALNLLLGGRASGELVGPAADSLTVAAVFALNTNHLPLLKELIGEEVDGDSLVIRRRVHSHGRSQSWINDLPVSVRALRAVGQALVEVRSQNDSLHLAQADYQLRLLDRFAGLEVVAQEYAQVHRDLRQAQQTQQELAAGEHGSARELEFINFQLAEFDSLQPQAGEFARLEERQELLAGAQEWRDLCEQTMQLISESEQAVQPLIAGLGKRLLTAPDEELRQAGEACVQAQDTLAEVVRLASSAADRLQPQPAELAEIEERLAALLGLMRKHGGSEERLFAAWQDLTEQAQALATVDERLRLLDEEIGRLQEQRAQVGQRLAVKRRQAAKKFAAVATAELAELGMHKVALSLEEHPQQQPSATAFIAQELYVQTNPGLPAGPLGKVPSGGELSRLSLAMTAALAKARKRPPRAGWDDSISVLVFDEIDAGVGGRLGSVIAEKLRQLAAQRTVIAISHTPQMAAQADRHYHVHKDQGPDHTQVVVSQLVGAERCQEIADMLGGGSAALNQAQVLLGDGAI